MKKLVSLLLAATMLFAMLAGCGGSGDNPSGTTTDTPSAPSAPGDDANQPAAEGGDYSFSDIITIICPVPAGGDTDRNTRILAQYMEKYAGVTVVVENIDGGATVMGMQECLDRSERNPDGTTLVVNGTDIFVPYMQGTSQINIDSFKSVAIPIIDNTTVLAVNKGSGWNTLEDLLADSKANPNKIEYGGKIGAANQICGIAMNAEWDAGLKFVDVGNNAAKRTALLGQQTDVINISYALAPEFESGDFLAICLLGPEKNPLLPDVPLASEYGLKDVDFSKFFWVGTGPTVPDEIVDNLAALIADVCKDPDFISEVESYQLNVRYIATTEAQAFANGMYTDTLLPYQEAFLAQQ